MSPSLRTLRREAADCRRCDLWKLGTQTVFGEGAVGGLLFVGEQPGDVEDREGHPFVGPAGRLLRELLEEAGIAEESVYLTNAVKHFKWRPAGKRRPRQAELDRDQGLRSLALARSRRRSPRWWSASAPRQPRRCWGARHAWERCAAEPSSSRTERPRS